MLEIVPATLQKSLTNTETHSRPVANDTAFSSEGQTEPVQPGEDQVTGYGKACGRRSEVR